ncbi:hypothetical protein LOTGIDRAFT_157148 [Lottia gigantea]|uniref:Uncharacterized protein n=1 Tax=Lottia gigantea TaxID=225164 RepID=V4CIL4_LOTGI|nr:hypothetical protein LOTGIDRAFT_157148 [Lottia gigantea]ESP02015.1 hypothetical protein LOTGIDRAFT_157148 [Lottia gigantea]
MFLLVAHRSVDTILADLSFWGSDESDVERVSDDSAFEIDSDDSKSSTSSDAEADRNEFQEEPLKSCNVDDVVIKRRDKKQGGGRTFTKKRERPSAVLPPEIRFDRTLEHAPIKYENQENGVVLKTMNDQLYYQTFIKEYSMTYSSICGELTKPVSLRDCYMILMLDNLVLLKYHNDPEPGEHRSKQMCMLPITLQDISRTSVKITWLRNYLQQVIDTDIENNENKKATSAVEQIAVFDISEQENVRSGEQVCDQEEVHFNLKDVLDEEANRSLYNSDVELAASFDESLL